MLNESNKRSLSNGLFEAWCMISSIECYSSKELPEINLDANTDSKDRIPTSMS